MQHTINRVVLQGAVGPPVVKLSPAGPIFAATELQIAETPTVTVTVCGIGIDAAAIADTQSGTILRVEGASRTTTKHRRFTSSPTRSAVWRGRAPTSSRSRHP